MGYEATKGVILYWKPDKPLIIHRSHHVWFDEYNSHLSIEDKHTPVYLLLRPDLVGNDHYSDILNLIPCKLDPTSKPFSDEIIITYDIELPQSEKKIGLIYRMMKILQSHTALILSPICQLVINFHHRLREMCGL